MSDAHTPTVINAPGVQPHDGHDNFLSPRNIIAFSLVLLFAIVTVMPYFKDIPAGRNGDQIVATSKVVETVIMLVLAFFFGTTVNASRREARSDENATAAVQAAALAASRPAQAPLVIEPPATLEVKESPDAHQSGADAGGPTQEAAAPPGAPGGQSRRIGPPE